MNKISYIFKRVICLAVALVCAVAVSACKDDTTLSDVSAENIAKGIISGAGYTQALVSRDRDYAANILGTDIPENFAFYSSDASADMTAVFVCEDVNAAKSLGSVLTSYIYDMTSEYEKYAPEEAVKLRNAVNRMSGSCVIVCVSPDYDSANEVVSEALADLAGFSDDSADISVPSGNDTDAEDDLPQTPETPAPATGYPIIEQNGEFEDLKTLIRCGNACFECYTYNENYVSKYNENINAVAQKMPDNVTVYNMIVPTSIAVTLPDALFDKVNSSDQPQSIKKSYAMLDDSVVSVDVYDNLMKHRDEYIYFRTDHHWTALGAYYAYSELRSVKGGQAPAIEEYDTVSFDGFLGSFYSSSHSSELAKTPDVVIAYYPVHNSAISTKFTDKNGNVYDWKIIFDVTDYPANSKYSTFAAADEPFVEITNTDVTDGSCCIVVKESYGNALVPFLADDYSKVYVVDYRYYTGNIKDLIPADAPVDLLFVNNISMLQSRYLSGEFSNFTSLIK